MAAPCVRVGPGNSKEGSRAYQRQYDKDHSGPQTSSAGTPGAAIATATAAAAAFTVVTTATAATPIGAAAPTSTSTAAAAAVAFAAATTGARRGSPAGAFSSSCNLITSFSS